jgi:NAD(P)-dependent dehydrogenase (short-subunit alcohol dehydrogenase family)
LPKPDATSKSSHEAGTKRSRGSRRTSKRGEWALKRLEEGSLTLTGKVALVAGATRGAGRGIAVELGAAGATVYVTGRTTRDQPSEYARVETIEETAALVAQSGGVGIAVQVDHLEPDAVQRLVDRIRTEQGHLDILVNDIWGGEKLMEWNKPVWEHDLQKGLRMLRLAVDTHLVTAHHALPLLIERPGGLLVEVTDGTTEYNATHYRLTAPRRCRSRRDGCARR